MRRRLLGLTLLLTATLAWWLWPPAALQTPAAVSLPAEPQGNAELGQSEPASPAASDRANVASYTPPPANPALAAIEARLPPIATPLAQAREALWSAARQGSGEAAWRLVVASTTCEQYQTVRTLVLREQGGAPKPERVAMEEFLVLAEPYCTGVTGDQQAVLREALQLGVEAGDVRALASYLLDPPLPRQLGIRLANELVRYRSQAPAIAQWLFDQGYADMPLILAWAYDGRSGSGLTLAPATVASKGDADKFDQPPPQRIQSPLGQVLPDDPALAWRYARLCRKVGGPYDRRQCEMIQAANEPALDDAQKEALQAWVDAQAKRDFSRSLPTGEGGTTGMYSL